MIALLAALLLSSGTCFPPPVGAPVAEPFREPACSYCPGHVGLGYALPEGTVVAAIAPGEVTFAGMVAGVRWVVVGLADGRKVSYGHLSAALVRRGQVVGTGQPVGLSSTWLHLGVRDGEVYLDPAPLLGWWQVRVRLVPAGGGPRRAGPDRRLNCPAVRPP